ncbi:hypothetical protein ACFLT1_00500 [Bacteroidota bacterium]
MSSFRINSLSIFFLAFIFLTSCDKPAGYGGTSNITGKISTKYYNEDHSLELREAPAVDEDVFLLFGDSEIVGDRVITGPEGSFAFEYLRPGSYTVYFLTEDITTSGISEVVMSFDIELAAGENHDLGELKKIKTLDYDEGNAHISGTIRLVNYRNSSQYPFLEVKDTSYAQDYEVYLVYGDHEYYDERIRTSYNGYFEFDQLIQGDYKVFTYSEDITGATENITIIKEVAISNEDDAVDLGTIFVEQL